MKNLPKLIISIIGCELIGILGSVFTVSSIPTWYVTLHKPSFAPPSWIFGPVWTLLYLLMGISFYLIWSQGWRAKKVRIARNYFLAQLGFNFIWSPVFFGLRSPFLGLIVIITMWTLIVMTMKKFYPLSKPAAYLLIPYLLWVSFATVLNASIVVLN
jgi:tryptophan-rich sensory protein